MLQKHRLCRGYPCVVLLVEDDEPTRDIMRRVMEHENWRVIEAENGRVALSRMEAGTLPDLILLDLMMPEMDGFEFASRLRSDPRWSDIPVIVLTAKDITDEDRVRLNGDVESILQKGGGDHSWILSQIKQTIEQTVQSRNAN